MFSAELMALSKRLNLNQHKDASADELSAPAEPRRQENLEAGASVASQPRPSSFTRSVMARARANCAWAISCERKISFLRVQI